MFVQENDPFDMCKYFRRAIVQKSRTEPLNVTFFSFVGDDKLSERYCGCKYEHLKLLQKGNYLTPHPTQLIRIVGVSSPPEYAAGWVLKFVPGASNNVLQKEYLVNQVLDAVQHSAFLCAEFGFRGRLDAVEGFVIATRFLPSWTLDEIIRTRQSFSVRECAEGLYRLLCGRRAVRTDRQVAANQVKWVHGDHHSKNILVAKHVEANGLRRWCYIDFSHSDCFFQQPDGLQVRVPLLSKDGSKSSHTPTASPEVEQLIHWFEVVEVEEENDCNDSFK